jgi:type IV pilus assembly protein PilX
MQRKIYCLNENGVALIAGLLILVVLSILGLSTMRSSLLQERMVGNTEQRDNAFEMAEAGLRHAENWLDSVVIVPPFNNNILGTNPDSVGLHDNPETDLLTEGGSHVDETTSGIWKISDTWSPDSEGNPTNYKEYDPDDINPDPSNPVYNLPRYYIEYMSPFDTSGDDSVKFKDTKGDSAIYRITSRGVSPNGRSAVILQTTYVR